MVGLEADRNSRRRPITHLRSRQRSRPASAIGPKRLLRHRGKPFPPDDLVTRLYLDVPLSPLNRETLYGGAEQGYTDYPGLRTVVTHACHADAERAWG